MVNRRLVHATVRWPGWWQVKHKSLAISSALTVVCGTESQLLARPAARVEDRMRAKERIGIDRDVLRVVLVARRWVFLRANRRSTKALLFHDFNKVVKAKTIVVEVSDNPLLEVLVEPVVEVLLPLFVTELRVLRKGVEFVNILGEVASRLEIESAQLFLGH